MKETLEQYGDVFIDVELKKHTSYKIGKLAKYLVLPANIDCLIDLIEYLNSENIPYLVLGSGSNIIIPNKDYEGVIIKLDNLNKIVIKGNKVTVGAGYYLPKLVKYTVEEGLKGLEWALGIPSSIGGAIVGNAGAYLSSIYDFVETVTYLNEKLQVVTVSKNKIDYSYRHSMFKNNKKLIILECKLELTKGNYDASMAVINDRMKRRLESQPLEYPSAGSVFRNPEGLYAGKLIEDLGLKGHIIGGAQISEKHANFIINIGNATGDDITALIDLIKEKVKDAYDVDLVVEQEIINWWFMKEKNKKKKVQKRFGFRRLIVIILIIYIIVSSIIQITKVPIKHIFISGNDLVSDSQIIKTAKLEKYPPIFLLSLSKTKDLILKIDLVKDVNIMRNYQGKLTIIIKEYKPLFYKKENNLVVLDSKKEIELDNKQGIPMLINYVPNLVYEEFVSAFMKVNKDIMEMMNYIEYSPSKNEKNEIIDDKRFLIQMNDSNKVYTTPEKLENINYYLDILTSLEEKKGTIYLDAGNYFKPFEEQNEK